MIGKNYSSLFGSNVIIFFYTYTFIPLKNVIISLKNLWLIFKVILSIFYILMKQLFYLLRVSLLTNPSNKNLKRNNFIKSLIDKNPLELIIS
jgi:hypothetical protein